MTRTMTALAGAAMAATLMAVSAVSAQASAQCGTASWYALTSKTASGERANPNAMTAAHRSLPFGTMVRVTNERNGRSVTVRINDRGPFIGGRIIDLSRAAAQQLGFVNAGTTRVCMSHSGRTTTSSNSRSRTSAAGNTPSISDLR